MSEDFKSLDELKPLGYNRFQLLALRNNKKVSTIKQGNKFFYLLPDVQSAKPKDFKYEELLRTKTISASSLLSQDEQSQLETLMKAYGIEFRHIVLRILNGSSLYLNEYSNSGPFNSYDNRSLFQLAQGFCKSQVSNLEIHKESLNTKITSLTEKLSLNTFTVITGMLPKSLHHIPAEISSLKGIIRRLKVISKESPQTLKPKKLDKIINYVNSLSSKKRKLNDSKLSLEEITLRKIPKFNFTKRDFYYSVGDIANINSRIRIENGFFYCSLLGVKKRVTNVILPENTIQTWTSRYNSKGKLVFDIQYRTLKTIKSRGVVGIDIGPKGLYAVKIDHNGCLREKKTFLFSNISNLREKKVELQKLLIKVVQWAGAYNTIVCEDLNFRQGTKGRTIAGWPHAKIRYILKNLCESRGIFYKEVNTAFTSFIGLVKYNSLGVSSSHNANSQDHSAALVIGRRGLGFKEALTSDMKEVVNNLYVASPSEKPSIQSRLWSKWSFIRSKIGEQTALGYVKVLSCKRGENSDLLRVKYLRQLRENDISGLRIAINEGIELLGLNLNLIYIKL